MSIYEYGSYKTFLRDQIKRMKRTGLMTELARSAGCDRTYLSQVLSGKVQLTSDHAVNLAEALALDTEESDYFLLLVLKERSSNPAATMKIAARLERLRKANAVLSKKIRQSDQPEELASDSQMTYYKSWKYTAVHILISLPNIRTPAQVAQAIGLNESDAGEILETLVKMGLAKRQGAQYAHSGRNLHISHESPLVSFNHLNWRMRAMDAATAPTSGVNVHYTDVFSISQSDIPALNALVLDFIERLRKKVHQSGAEAAFAFCCDLFPFGSPSKLK